MSDALLVSPARLTSCSRMAIVTAICAATAFAQAPLIYSRSVFNAASFMPAGIPGGGIAQGAIFSLFGTRMGPAQGVQATTYPLGTTLGGAAISIIQGSTTVPALPVYVSATQINAIMPSNAPLGMASIQVSYNGVKSSLAPVRIVRSAFGIFTVLGTGMGPGILQNYVSASNQPINATDLTAQPGQVITLWGTGLGPISGGDNIAPPAGNLPGSKVEVFVGGLSASVLYSGRTPCCSGTDQVVFTVPDKAPLGCWVPVYVRVNGTSVSNVVTMAIGTPAASCGTDAFPQITSAYVGRRSLAAAMTIRAVTLHDVGVKTPLDASADYHAALAFPAHQEPVFFNPMMALPPAGTCTAYTHQGDILAGSLLPGTVPSALPLSFGAPMVLTGPGAVKTLTPDLTGIAAGYLGGAVSNNVLPSSLFLSPGSYTLQGFGGFDIGAFTAAFSIPQPLTWSNRAQTTIVRRTQPLTLNWTGGDSTQTVAIIGFGEDLPTNSSAVFACIAPPGANSFSVPPDILANLPASRANPLLSKNVIYLVSVGQSSMQPLPASGIDVGLTSFYSVIGKTVSIQ